METQARANVKSKKRSQRNRHIMMSRQKEQDEDDEIDSQVDVESEEEPIESDEASQESVESYNARHGVVGMRGHNLSARGQRRLMRQQSPPEDSLDESESLDEDHEVAHLDERYEREIGQRESDVEGDVESEEDYEDDEDEVGEEDLDDEQDFEESPVYRKPMRLRSKKPSI